VYSQTQGRHGYNLLCLATCPYDSTLIIYLLFLPRRPRLVALRGYTNTVADNSRRDAVPQSR